MRKDIILLFLFFQNVVPFNRNACKSLSKYPIADISSSCYYNPDVSSNVEEMCQRHNYQLQNFSVTTDDGYILTLFKVFSKNNKTRKNPVFLQHGLMLDATSWLDKGSPRSLAFFLADKGYDVWLSNIRGTTYSKTHKNLTVNNPKFWDFNLDILAEQDLTAQLNFVQKNSIGKINYIGYSMGTTLYYMLASSNQKIAEKLQSAILLAPVGYLSTPITDIATLIIPILEITTKLKITGLFYQDQIVHQLFYGVCKLVPLFCFDALNTLLGKTKNFLPEDFLLMWTHTPVGISVYQLIHYLQIAKSGRIQKYDFGTKINIQKYGQRNPPLYNLSNIQVPTCFFYGENDILYQATSLDKEFAEIGSSKKCRKAIRRGEIDEYNHSDFVYSVNIEGDLYLPILTRMEEFEKF